MSCAIIQKNDDGKWYLKLVMDNWTPRILLNNHYVAANLIEELQKENPDVEYKIIDAKVTFPELDELNNRKDGETTL